MIELNEVKKETESVVNTKEDRRDTKPSFASTKNSKQPKKDKKEKEIKKLKININLSVNDIYNMILMQEDQNKSKFGFFCAIIIFTLIMINAEFIFFLGYMRPTLLTNKYYCYDSITRHYKKCLTDSFCYCNHDYCTTFCYNTNISECPDVFESQKNDLIKNKLITIPDYMRSLKYETKIIYPIESKENVSVFQRIGYYYCFLDRYLIGFICDFVLGCILGYYIFGLIADLYGRKKCIIILSIIALISNGGIMIISNYAFNENKRVLIALWFIFILLLGASLEPLESAVYIYFMEMFPDKVTIKPVSCVLFIRYIISLLMLWSFDKYPKNLVYFFYAFEAYLVPFLIIIIFVFRDTPRFYSERQDINNKMWGFFITDIKTFTCKEHESDDNIDDNNFLEQKNKIEENQRNSKIIDINYSYLYSKFKANNTISKNYYIILFANIVLNFCFYTILLKFIFFFFDPNNEFSLSFFLPVFIVMFVFYVLLQVLFYILFELFSLSFIVATLLFITFIVGVCFEYQDFKLLSYRYKFYNPEWSRKVPHCLSASLFFILFVISIYEMMLVFLSPTLYRCYFFFCQKGVSFISLIFAFIAVFSFDLSIFFIGIISLFACFLFLTLRVKWEKISLKEEINKKVKNS